MNTCIRAFAVAALLVGFGVQTSEGQNYPARRITIIVPFTPGTAWVQLSADRRVLLLHVFSASADEPVVAAIKGRYERPLREIFE